MTGRTIDPVRVGAAAGVPLQERLDRYFSPPPPGPPAERSARRITSECGLHEDRRVRDAAACSCCQSFPVRLTTGCDGALDLPAHVVRLFLGEPVHSRPPMPSFSKMLVMCFGRRARSPRALGDALVRAALRHQLEHSRSRGVSSASGSSRRRRPRSWDTIVGSSAEPPSATRRTAAANSFTSLTRSLSR